MTSMMRPGKALLLPASPWFMALSVVLAIASDMLAHAWLGPAVWMPDLLALVLVFWIVHQPLRVGVTTAFVLGLLLDVHQGAVLGQNALAYVVMAYLGTVLRRRLQWFDLGTQALHLLPVFVLMHLLQTAASLLAGGSWPSWWLMLPPFAEALLWPLVTVLLLAPQRRAHDPDDNRPI